MKRPTDKWMDTHGLLLSLASRCCWYDAMLGQPAGRPADWSRECARERAKAAGTRQRNRRKSRRRKKATSSEMRAAPGRAFTPCAL